MLALHPTFALRLFVAAVLLLGNSAAAQDAAALKKAQDDAKKQQDDVVKKAIDDFNAAIKEAKTVQEKALALQTLGEFQPRENALVAPIRKYLAPGAGDINFILPVTAAEALSKFRGSAAASAALIGVLPAYRKMPYVYDKIILAIGKVGHESALALFEAPIKEGKDATAACNAVQAIAEMPPVTALECLFRNAEEIDKKLPKAGNDQKAFYDKVQAELLKAVRKVSGEPYPTLKELQIWWQKRGQAFKEKAAEKEKEAQAKKPEAAAAPAKPSLPPVMIVELTFRENAGTSSANTGSSSGNYTSANLVGPKPWWSASAPPNGGPSSLDWGPMASPCAVDLGAGGVEHLKNLKSFTITGWVNCRAEMEAAGDKAAAAGNRIVTWLNHGKDGVELVHRTGGNLQLGVNQWAADSSASSAPKIIPTPDPKATDPGQALTANWRFFAVTYDSTAAAGHVKFYIGTAQADAKLVDKPVDYPRGAVGPRIGPTLTVGNVNGLTRQIAPDRSFKGLIDEVRVFGSTADGSGALSLPEIIKVQNRVVPQG
jgi:hypothetical protein